MARDFSKRGSTATNTGSLDQLRQGVSVRTMEQRFGGVIPRFSAGSPPDILVNGKLFKGENRFFDDSVEFPEKVKTNVSGTQVVTTPINDTEFNRVSFAPNHKMIRRDFGQPKLFKDDEPFEDMPKWNPVQFMEDDGCSMIYPYILANVSMRDPDQMDGVIEPLAIRSRASRNSIDWPYEAHSVKGFLLDGAEDSRGNSIPIKQQVDLGPQSFEPFDDGGFEFFGHGQYQKLDKNNETVYYDDSVKWQGYLHDQPEVISPYVDATDRTLAFEPLNSGSNVEIFNVVTSITGSIDDINDRGHKSATAGFVYFGAEDGTDSLAFGGLKK